MMIQPFNSGDEHTAPAYWVLETQYRQLSLAQMLQRFYDDFDPTEPLTYDPLGVVYNPEDANGKRFYSFDNEQVVVFAYRRGFYIVVEKHWRYMEGPHSTKLFYKCHQIKDTIWIATLQLNGMFYNEEAMLSAVILAVINQEFYQSEKSANEIVML